MILSEIIKSITNRQQNYDGSSSFNKYCNIYKYVDNAVIISRCKGEKEARVRIQKEGEKFIVDDKETDLMFDVTVKKMAETVKEHLAWEGLFNDQVSIEELDNQTYMLVVRF